MCFSLFLEHRDKIIAESPGMTPRQVMQKIEDLWMNMPHSQKLRYNLDSPRRGSQQSQEWKNRICMKNNVFFKKKFYTSCSIRIEKYYPEFRDFSSKFKSNKLMLKILAWLSKSKLKVIFIYREKNVLALLFLMARKKYWIF